MEVLRPMYEEMKMKDGAGEFGVAGYAQNVFSDSNAGSARMTKQ